MTVDDYIANYLRDAQYKIALLSVDMNKLEDQGSYSYNKLFKARLELATFMRVLYEGKWLVSGGYNHLQIGETSTDVIWTERQVIEEIEYLRYTHGMNEVPYITFTAHYPKIASSINGGGSGSGGSLPAGQYGQLIGYDGGGNPEAQSIDSWGGHQDNETINTYFSGRI
jgi:hypothetical protein